MDKGYDFRCSTSPDPVSRSSLQPTADYILKQASTRGHTPTLGIVCGSGLGELAAMVEFPLYLPYTDIPGFPVSTAPGHKGRLVIGRLRGVTVLLMQGRLHTYEGYPLWKVTLPIRVMKMVGVSTLIVTNAVGGLNPAYKVGDIMLVKDHINMFGFGGSSPLRGPNDEFFGPRFFAVNEMYNKRFRSLALWAAKEVGIEETIHEGVLSITGGPNYESVAELKMMARMGVDCVGMSNIPESLVGHHCGMQLLSFCLVTNQCCVDMEAHTSAAPNHEEVLDAAEMKKEDLKQFVGKIVEHLPSKLNLRVGENGST